MKTLEDSKFRTPEIVFYAVVFLLVNLLTGYFQKPISLNGGKGWDGFYYYQIAEQFAQGGTSIRVDAPYCYRIGTPFLAALASPQNLLLGFKAVNLAANVLTFILFVLWIRLFISDWRIRCLLGFLLLTQWLGPFRAIYWHPATTDNWGYFFLLLGLLCIYYARSRPVAAAVCLSLVLFVGVAFREPLLLLALAMVFVDNPIRFGGLRDKLVAFRFAGLVSWPRLIYLLPIAFGLAGIVCVHQMVHQTNTYTFSGWALGLVYDKPWHTYVHALLIAFGPILVLALFNWRRSLDFFASNQALLVFLAGAALLAYIGGHDTERYWYWAMPVVYVLIGKAIADNRQLLQSAGLIALLCLSQAITQRLLWTFPDFPNNYHTPLPLLTVLGSKCQVLDLYAYHGRRLIEVVSLAEYALLAVAILWWLAYRARRIAASSGLELMGDETRSRRGVSTVLAREPRPIAAAWQGEHI